MGHCDCRKSRRPGRKRRPRTPAPDVVSGVRVAGATANDIEMGWPELGVSVLDTRPDAHPLDTRQDIISHRSERGSGRVRGSKEATCGIGRCDAQGQEPAPCRQRRQLTKQVRAMVEQQKCRRQRKRGKVRPGHDLHEAAHPDFATMYDIPSHIKVGGPMFLGLMSSFSTETEFTRFVNEEIATASDPDARQPTSWDCRPYTALSRTSQQWVLARVSHCQRARSEVSIVVPHWRDAWIRWLPVVTSEAAAKHCFMLLSKDHRSQIQNQSGFRATQRTGPVTDSLLALQLQRYSIGYPHEWRTIFATQRTPTRFVTTLHSLLWPCNSGALFIRRMLWCELA